MKPVDIPELMTKWDAGDERSVAAELAKRQPSSTVQFAAALFRGYNSDTAFVECERLSELLKSVERQS